MQTLFGLGAKISAVIGTAACLVAGVARVLGHSYVAGFESMTLFIGGMALMLLGVLLKLESLPLELGK